MVRRVSFQDVPAGSTRSRTGSSRRQTRRAEAKVEAGGVVGVGVSRGVAIEQKWTIKDIKTIALPREDLYFVAVNTFKLKDGVVRHLDEDIQRFKSVRRAAAGLSGLAVAYESNKLAKDLVVALFCIGFTYKLHLFSFNSVAVRSLIAQHQSIEDRRALSEPRQVRLVRCIAHQQQI